MMLYSVVLILSLEFVNFSACVHTHKTTAYFRKDYTFLESTQSFYKIHTIRRTWREAKKRCTLEGAKFFYPEDSVEAYAVMEFMNKTQPYYHVYVGIDDFISKGVFETVDGRSVNDIFNVWGPGEPNDAGGVEDCVVLRREVTYNDDRCDKKYPFICKKTLANLNWNVLCDKYDTKYLYEGSLGKCYKFHRTPMNWTDAYALCNTEESYLAVINSKKEAEFLVNLTARTNKEIPTRDYLAGHVHLGYHNLFDEGWKTVRGTTLEESGYTNWAYLQPDSSDKRGETCGGMFYNGQLNDIHCSVKTFFICEHDIGSLSTAIDERIGDIG